MLSRIANNLFWMGRYLERAQHTARFVHVHYFSALDAPTLLRKEFVMDSISAMTGLEYEYLGEVRDFKDEELIYKVIMDAENPVSIFYSVLKARENARGARDMISTELWESVNKFYHEVNSWNSKGISEAEILEFTQMIVEQCSIVSSYIDNSLLHNDTWSLIKLGKHTEGAGQITRILIAKVKDIRKAEKSKPDKVWEAYQCATLLKSLEAFDMSSFYYRSSPNFMDALDFLILNKEFPRSLVFNLEEVNKCICRMRLGNGEEKKSPEFYSGKLSTTFSYLTIEEIHDDLDDFLEKVLLDIYKFGELVELKIV